MNKIKEFTGFFTEDDIIFSNLENNYFITFFNLEDGNKIKVKGIFESGVPEGFIKIKIKKEEEYRGEITYVVDKGSKYVIPQKKESIIKYINNFFKVSENQAIKIYNFFTEEDSLSFFEELDKDHKKVREIPKLFRVERKYDELIELLGTERFRRKIRFFLYEYSFTETQIKKILEDEKLSEMGEEIIDEIKKNPYNLLKVSGITFNQIDSIYLNNGGSLIDANRIYAGILYYLKKYCVETSGIYMELNELKFYIEKELRIQFDLPTFSTYVGNLEEKNIGKIKDLFLNDSLKILKYNGKYWIFIYYFYFWEKYIAERVRGFLEENETMNKEKFILPEEHKSFGNIKINEDQQNAIENCFNYRFSIIRGYGGTGKSTIIKKIVDIAREKGLNFTLLAPTGKAVDVLIKASGTPSHCFTIHRKLGLIGEGEINNSEIKKIKEDIILVDESSMIATPLMYSLLSCIEDHQTVVFLGDDNQLKPVGIGEPFLDMISSRLIPETHLTKIYRQKEGSLILENSKNLAEMKEIKYHKTHDWLFFDILGKSEKKIKELVLEEIKKEGFDKEDDIVISAKYKGDAGIEILNTEIQNYLNKDNKEIYEKGFNKYYLGDRVMNLSNLYFREEDIFGDFIFGLPLEILTSKSKIESIFSRYSEELNGDKNNILKKIRYNGKNKTLFLQKGLTGDDENKRPVLIKIGKFDDEGDIIFEEEDDFEEIEEPDFNVFNGNYGEIVAIKRTKDNTWKTLNGKEIILDLDKYSKNVLLVNFGDKYFFYKEDDLKNLTLFYASTVHKMQGSQFKRVYGICSPKDFFMIDRNWLYTMMSRAKEEFIFFSNPDVVKRVQYKKGTKRRTFLPIFLYKILTDKEKYKL